MLSGVIMVADVAGTWLVVRLKSSGQDPSDYVGDDEMQQQQAVLVEDARVMAMIEMKVQGSSTLLHHPLQHPRPDLHPSVA